MYSLSISLSTSVPLYYFFTDTLFTFEIFNGIIATLYYKIYRSNGFVSH